MQKPVYSFHFSQLQKLRNIFVMFYLFIIQRNLIESLSAQSSMKQLMNGFMYSIRNSIGALATRSGSLFSSIVYWSKSMKIMNTCSNFYEPVSAETEFKNSERPTPMLTCYSQAFSSRELTKWSNLLKASTSSHKSLSRQPSWWISFKWLKIYRKAKKYL